MNESKDVNAAKVTASPSYLLSSSPTRKDAERSSADGVVEPLLLTAKQAAAICGKSLRTWRTWDSAGWIPQPVRIGRSTLWRADELREWVAAGCPRRAEWEARSC